MCSNLPFHVPSRVKGRKVVGAQRQDGGESVFLGGRMYLRVAVASPGVPWALASHGTFSWHPQRRDGIRSTRYSVGVLGA